MKLPLIVFNFIILFTFLAQSNFVSSQESDSKSNVNSWSEAIELERFIEKNSQFLINFDEQEVLLQYNSLSRKEVNYSEYLSFKKVDAIKKAMHQQHHMQQEDSPEILDCSNFGFENADFSPGWTGGTSIYGNPFTGINIDSAGINALTNNYFARHLYGR